MPIKNKYTLMCDEVRIENNGKFFIIGLYTPDIAAAQIPVVLPSLTFFACLESDRPGNFMMTMKLVHVETGNIVVEARGGIVFQRPGLAFAPIRFGNAQFNAVGPYHFSLEIVGEPEPFVTEFQVRLGFKVQQVVPPQPTQ